MHNLLCNLFGAFELDSDKLNEHREEGESYDAKYDCFKVVLNDWEVAKKVT